MSFTSISRLGIAALLFIGIVAACGTPASPRIEAKEVWARPAMAVKESGESVAEGMGMGGTGAVFMQLVNTGNEADRLVGGQTDVAQALEIHETVREGDVMKMKMLPEGLEVPAKGEVLLKPGSYHIMLIGLQRDLHVGDSFAVTLHFEKSGSITVQPEVREP